MKLVAKTSIFHKNSARSYARFEVFETENPNDFSELHFVKVADNYALPDCDAKYLAVTSDGLPVEMSPEEKQMIDESDAARQLAEGRQNLLQKKYKREAFLKEMLDELWLSNEQDGKGKSFVKQQISKFKDVLDAMNHAAFDSALDYLQALPTDEYLSPEMKAYFVGKIENFLNNEN